MTLFSPPSVKQPFFQSGNKVGSGSYGSVFEEHNKLDSVVKVYDKSSELQCSVIREISALVLLNGKCSIPAINAVYLEDTAHRISMSKSDSSLSMIIGKYQLSEELVKTLLFEMLKILTTMANFNIVQRDIKPANILCTVVEDAHGKLLDLTNFKLCDFGLARFTNSYSTQYLTGNIQTLWYKSPEILLHDDGNYQLDRVDIWSLAIVAIELLTGNACVPANDNKEQLLAISQIFGTPNLEGTKYKDTIINYKRQSLKNLMPHISSDLINILEQMTSVDPKERPNAFELINNAYFNTRSQQIRKRIELNTSESIAQIKKMYPINITKLNSWTSRKSSIEEIIFLYQHEVFINPETLIYAVQLMDLTLTRASNKFMETYVKSHKMLIAAIVALSCKVHEHYTISTDILAEHLNIDYDDTIKLEREIFKLMDCMLFIPIFNACKINAEDALSLSYKLQNSPLEAYKDWNLENSISNKI